MPDPAFLEYLRDIAPRGSWWQSPAGEKLYASLYGAWGAAVEFVLTMPSWVSPLTTPLVPILLQYLEYLQVVACVPVPIDEDELRARVLALLGATSPATTAGLAEVVAGYLPLVEIVTDQPAYIPGSVPLSIDGAPNSTTAWYSPLHDTPAVVDCVVRVFAPANGDVRMIYPTLELSRPSSSTLAGDSAVHWHNLRGDTVLDALLYGPGPGFPVFDDKITAVDSSGVALVSDLLDSTPAPADLSGHRLDISANRTWAGGTRAIAELSFTWP